ncbi:hypothetical protein [Brachybacterium muris]|nr:hypothetical protein [Brachybacterium muris]
MSVTIFWMLRMVRVIWAGQCRRSFSFSKNPRGSEASSCCEA